tara:strand:- start:121 stop:390 length:270 start_codon:yes stop_codon:yes gene_type:complete
MNNVVVKYFSATWCGPCKSMKPGMEDLKKEGYPIEFLDVEENKELASNAGVRAVPTIIIYENNEPVETLVGAQDVERLKKKINVYYEPK